MSQNMLVPARLQLVTPARSSERETIAECDLLAIEELEPRLTPDGYNPYNSNPPGRQVGWGC
jgi:hypothetical protein